MTGESQINQGTQKRKRVLILHRDVTMPGGVEKYFLKMRDKFSDDVDYFIIGRRPGESGAVSQIVRLVRDYFRFAAHLIRNHYQLIHLNPCIDSDSFLRESVFHFLARARGCRTIVFFRTWHPGFQARLDRHPWLFRLLYGRADAYIVMASELRNCLARWGANRPVFQEIAVADDNWLTAFDMNKALAEREKNDEKEILFAARVTRDKGIHELIGAMQLLQEKGSRARLTVAGDSDELEQVKQKVSDLGLTNIHFAGWLERDELDALLKKSGIFCLPTYFEGFPQAVVEAMAVGLPIVTRPVGGLKDFFRNGVHGFITESKDSRILAELLEKLIDDPPLYRKISQYNYQFAAKNFLASSAAARLQRIYDSVLEDRVIVPESPFVQPDEDVQQQDVVVNS